MINIRMVINVVMRNPAVAGQFYPSSKEELKNQIEKCFLSDLGPGRLPEGLGHGRDIIGAVVPHAGYVYSGYEAAHVYFELARQEKPDTVVILGPNHTGYGSTVAVSKETWKTPFGDVETNQEMTDQLFKDCEIINLDERAHLFEHSIEVQLPFLQYIYGDFKFVPISLGIQDAETAREIGKCLARIKDDILIIASSDFTHYESLADAKRKDGQAMEHILNLDEDLFLKTVYENDMSICGHGPIAACIVAVKGRGATTTELLKYGTSGEITGDRSQVVAYSGIVFKK